VKTHWYRFNQNVKMLFGTVLWNYTVTCTVWVHIIFLTLTKFLSHSKKTQTHATARKWGKPVHVPGENSTLKFSEADRISEGKHRQFLSCLENNPMHHY